MRNWNLKAARNGRWTLGSLEPTYEELEPFTRHPRAKRVREFGAYL